MCSDREVALLLWYRARRFFPFLARERYRDELNSVACEVVCEAGLRELSLKEVSSLIDKALLKLARDMGYRRVMKHGRRRWIAFDSTNIGSLVSSL